MTLRENHPPTTKELAERIRSTRAEPQPGADRAGKTRRASLATLMVASLASCAAVSPQAVARSASFDPIQLQDAFARAKNLSVLNRVADIPSDGHALLVSHFSWTGLGAPLADIGMNWSFGDAVMGPLPRHQHRFSAVNDELLLVVYVTGEGDGVHYGALLAPRHAQRYCTFDLGAYNEQYLSVSALQVILNPDQHPAAAKAPECVQRDMY